MTIEVPLKMMKNAHISRSKDNQAIKFGQLIEYNIRNIFLEKSYTQCGGETICQTLFSKTKMTTSLDQYSKVLYSFFTMIYAKSRSIEIY